MMPDTVTWKSMIALSNCLCAKSRRQVYKKHDDKCGRIRWQLKIPCVLIKFKAGDFL